MELVVNKITKSFGEKHVLKDISFTAKSGKAFGLLGRNGSGKTTTIRIIMDIFPSDSGEVTIDGLSNKKTKVRIGYLPEERGLYPKRLISDQMIYFGRLRGLNSQDARQNAKSILERLDAGEYFGKKLETLSKGNQQKIQLAIAVLNNPDIVILDEPFSGLDPVNAILLKDLVGELVKNGRMVIFSSHQMSYVEEFCDDICLINNGKIVVDGDLRQIKRGYPRNRMLITLGDDEYERLGAAIKNDSLLIARFNKTEITERGLLVELNDPLDKQLFFSTPMLSSFNIDSIKVVEPTLEQIFIEKAGGSDEAVS